MIYIDSIPILVSNNVSIVDACRVLLYGNERTRTTTTLRFEHRHPPTPSLHNFSEPACFIARDHSIRKGDYLPLDEGVRPAVIAIDARSRRHNRFKKSKVGIQISMEPNRFIENIIIITQLIIIYRMMALPSSSDDEEARYGQRKCHHRRSE